MKYFMIGAQRLTDIPNRHVGLASVEIGEVIEFHGVPGHGMVPIDLDADAAKQNARNRPGYSDLNERRMRAKLPSNIAMQLKVHEDALQAAARAAG